MHRILSTRELRTTLESLSVITSSVRYHSVDVSEAEAVRRVIEDIHDRWGRIDGVIHGAGVLEDRMLADKTPESFDRVFRTKVDGARGLAAALQGRPPLRFFALFGSVSGVFGNPGQVDYAAANDALDTLARMWDGRVAHRVVSLDWGPWASTGMSTFPARFSAAASFESSGFGESKNTSNTMTRAPALRRSSTAWA